MIANLTSGAAVVAAGSVALTVLFVVPVLANRKHRAEWPRLAESRGWTYAKEDPSLIRLDFSLTRSRRLKIFVDVISFRHAGISMKRFTLVRTDGRNSTMRSVIAAKLPTRMPRLIALRRYSPLRGRHRELQRFEGGDEPFRRAFIVWTDDPAFAAAALNPLMTDWMLSLEGRFGFEVSGARAFAYGGSRRPRDVDALIEACTGFVERLPAPTAGW